MAMMISKFHKLIQSKVVWTVFAVLISVAFVGVYTGSQSSGAKERAQQQAAIAGTLWGEEISSAEFGAVYRQVYMLNDVSMMMTYGQGLNMDDETAAMIREQAWIRLATIKKAGQMGIGVSNEQTIESIKAFPLFQNRETGGFNKAMYDQFTANILPRYGMTPKDFENLIRANALVSKAAGTAAQGALVTEDEVKEIFHTRHDTLTIEYATLPRSIAEEPVISDEDAQAYYDANGERFRLPEKAVVHYIEFPVTDFTNSVAVTDEQIANTYEQAKQRYIVPETATNDVPEYLPLEEVKEEITADLTLLLARQEAFNTADMMVANLSNEGATFESEAEKAGRKVVSTTPPFTATGVARNVDPTAPFVRATFALDADSETDYYSDPVVGRDSVYVIALKKIIPPFLPAFDVVKDDVVETARMEAAEKAYFAKAETVHADIESALKEGASFTDAAAKHNLELVTSAPFNASAPLEGAFSQEIMSATIPFEKGTLVDLISGPDDLLVAYVANKEIAEEGATLDAEREEISAAIRGEKAGELVRAWQASLLEEAEFEDLTSTES